MWVKCCRLMDYNMFDCLLTLCELCKDLPPLLRDLWQLLMLMLIPTQADLLQQSVERMCMDKESEEIGRLLRQYHQLDVDSDPVELIVQGRRPPLCCGADHR